MQGLAVVRRVAVRCDPARSNARTAAPVTESTACEHDDHDDEQKQSEQRTDPDATGNRRD